MNTFPGILEFDLPRSGERIGFTFGEAARLLRKHRLLIAATFVFVTAAVMAGVSLMPPSYSSSALVLVKLEQVGAPSFFAGIAPYRDSSSQDNASRSMENEMEIAESWPLAADTVRQLGLTYGEVYHSPLAHLLRPVSDMFDRYVAPHLGIRPDPNKFGFEETVEAFMSGLEVRPVVSKTSDTNSNIVSFTLRGVDPERTRQSLETLVNLYLVHDLNDNKAAADSAAGVITRRMEIARAEMVTAQSQLEALLAGSDSPRTDGDEGERSSAPKASSTADRLRSRIQDLKVALIEQRSQTDGGNAQTRALEDTIKALQSQLDTEQRASARQEAELMSVQRDLRLKESGLTELQKRLSQIAMYQEVGLEGLTNRVVIEPPLKARTSDWKKHVLIVIAGGMAGLLLGVTLAGLRELLDPRIQTASDARAVLDMPVLAVMPTFKPGAFRKSLATLRPTSLLRDEHA